MKRALKIAAVVLILAVAVLLLLPPFIDLGYYKARYLPLVEEALQRKVDVGEVRLRILPSPAIRFSRLNISDDPAFSTRVFFTARQMSLRLKLGPLLRGRFQVDEFVLEKPVANLVKRTDGTFNFADLGQKKGEREKKKASAEEKNPKTGAPVRLSELVPARVRIEDGEVTLQSNDQKPLKVQGIDLSIEDFSTGQSFPYRAALRLPGLKPVVLEGLANYSESEASFSLKENHLKVQGVDFAVNGAVTRLTAAPQADLAVSNETFESKPIFQLLSETGLMPKGLEISGPMGLRVSVKGPFDRLTASANIDLKKLQVNDPRAFKGVLTGKVQLSLPLGGKAPVAQLLQGSGKVTARDGVLTNVDVLSKIQLLTGIIGVPGDQSRGATTFKSLESDFTLGGEIVEFQRLFLTSPLLEARGGGKMALFPPSLDLSIETALSPEISARAGSGKAATFFKDDQGRLVTPLKVRGAANRPSVDLDKEKLVRKGVGQFLERGPGQLFERFFKKK